MPENNDGAAEFAPQDMDTTPPEDFQAETPAVEEVPAVEGVDIAPVEVEVTPTEPEAPLTNETKVPSAAMDSEGGAVQETPFRTQ